MDKLSTVTSGNVTPVTSYLTLDGTSYWDQQGLIVNVSFRGYVNFSAIGTANSLTVIASNVPAPKHNQVITCIVMIDGSVVITQIGTDGTISINNSVSKLTTSSVYVFFSATYIAASY